MGRSSYYPHNNPKITHPRGYFDLENGLMYTLYLSTKAFYEWILLIESSAFINLCHPKLNTMKTPKWEMVIIVERLGRITLYSSV